jgi:hypothetical protein
MLAIDTESREWIDSRCSWIIDQFGLERILSSKVIAADADLLERYRADDYDSVLALFRKICETMDIEFESIQFYFMENQRQDDDNGVLGLYESLGNGMHSISIDQALLESPVELIATLAHELCHVLLIGHNRITGEEDDHEPLTDLLTVFLGFGALSGNSVLRDESWHEGHARFWQIRRAGYLTMPMYGYAIAIFAMLRNEGPREWKPRLRLDVRNAFMRSIKYFQRQGLPDLSKVISTDSRPRLYAEESTPSPPPPKLKLRHGYYDDEDDVDEEYEDEVDYEYRDSKQEEAEDDAVDIPQCVYCGAQARRYEPYPLCADCSKSINENEKEIERELSGDSMPSSTLVTSLYLLSGIFVGLTIFAVVIEVVRGIFR